MSFKKVSFEEFKRNKKAHDKLKTIKEGTRNNISMSRYEYDEEYDVYFDPDNIMMVTKDNLRYYTISLLKQPNDSLIKNLILSENPDLSFTAKILGYKLTDEEIELMKQGINQDLTDKIFEKTIDDGFTFSDTYTNLCGLEINYNYIPNYCCDGIHSYGQTCNYDGTNCAPPPHTVVIQVVYVLCPEESVGGPTSPSNPTNPTNPPTDSGGGSTGDGSSPEDENTAPINNEAEQEIITTPLLPGLTSDVQEIDDPCAKLNRLFTDAGLNLGAEINYLKDRINDPSNQTEHGVPVTKRANEFTGEAEYRPGTRIALGANGGNLPTGGYVIGGIHCHTPKGYSMFTFEDVNSLKNLYNAISTVQRRKEAFFMMVAKDKVTDSIKTYSILVEDINQLTAEIENKLISPEVSDIDNLSISDEEKVNRKLFKLSRLSADKYPNENQGVLENSFLQEFATFGISMYKANADLTNWTKLELPENPNSTQPKKTPCN